MAHIKYINSFRKIILAAGLLLFYPSWIYAQSHIQYHIGDKYFILKEVKIYVLSRTLESSSTISEDEIKSGYKYFKFDTLSTDTIFFKKIKIVLDTAKTLVKDVDHVDVRLLLELYNMDNTINLISFNSAKDWVAVNKSNVYYINEDVFCDLFKIYLPKNHKKKWCYASW